MDVPKKGSEAISLIIIAYLIVIKLIRIKYCSNSYVGEFSLIYNFFCWKFSKAKILSSSINFIFYFNKLIKSKTDFTVGIFTRLILRFYKLSI